MGISSRKYLLGGIFRQEFPIESIKGRSQRMISIHFYTRCRAASVCIKRFLFPQIKTIVFILILLIPVHTLGIERADKVLVVKSESKLYLIKDKKVLSVFKVAFGANPKGHKQQEGDEKTPEGKYILDYKKSDSAFYKAIHISYPNDEDIKRAKEAGVSPGGFIMVHGQKNGFGWLAWITQHFNWTNGCIAVSNSAMDEIWEAVTVGTPIEIKP